MRRRSILLVSVPLLATLVGGATASAQEGGWRYHRLDLEIDVDPARAHLEVRGHGVLEVTAAMVEELALGVNTRTAAMRFIRVAAPGVASDVELTLDAPLHSARLPLDAPLSRGDSLAVEFTLRWVVPSFQTVVNDSIAVASWTEAWYPIPLRPGGAKGSWGASGRTRFHLPPGWRAVSNGSLRSTEVLGDSSVVEVWESTTAVHRSFAAAPYRVAQAITGKRPIPAAGGQPVRPSAGRGGVRHRRHGARLGRLPVRRLRHRRDPGRRGDLGRIF